MEKEAITIKVDGLNLATEVYYPGDAQSGPYPALCICHGIPRGLPPDPTDSGYPGLARWFCDHGFLVLIFNFRGTGESQGNFDMLGWSRDLAAVLDYLEASPAVDKARIAVMGFSGGAATTAYVAAHDARISSIVLCACPAQFRGSLNVDAFLGQARRAGLIRDPNFPPSTEEWASGFEAISPIQWVDKVAPRPLLIVHGSADAVVDVSQAFNLYEKALPPKELRVIEGGEHRLRTNQQAMNAALEWLLKVNGLEP